MIEMEITIDVPEIDLEKLKVIIDIEENENAIHEAILFTIDNY